MGNITIKNEFLKVEICPKGAELVSVYKGQEKFLWEIDRSFWDKTSPVLFPIVGGLKEGSYEFDGRKYQLPRHGFARDYDFEITESTEDSATFTLKHSHQTLEIYPFEFTLSIKYYVLENKLFIQYIITNTSSINMYYSIGAHPAFSIVGSLENYSLEFDRADNLTAYKLSNNLFSGETKEIVLDEKLLPLNYSLFEQDAIVLKNSTTSHLTLLKDQVPKFKVSFPDFPFVGIWTKTNAPFICIEPWLGLADSHHTSGKLEEKEGILSLTPESTQSHQWSVEFY